MKLATSLFSNADAILVSSPSNIKYLTGYSGFSEIERECFLLLTKNRKYLITDERYAEAVAKQVPEFKVIPVGVGRFIHQGDKVLDSIPLLGIEEEDLKVTEYKAIKKRVRKTVNINLSDIRIVKESNEVKKIEKACALGDKAFNYITKKIKVGLTEKELAKILIQFIVSQGVEISFSPIVAFGKNSSVPHHLSGNTKLKSNSIVLLDFGVKFDNYCSDMTRTIFFGSHDKKFNDIHKTVLEAQLKAIKAVKPGTNASEIDKIARTHILSKGYPNVIHSIGHGIGIDVHEAPHLSPFSDDLFSEGMVFSIEPGIYLPGYGGVRIEDLFLVTKNGSRKLTHSPVLLNN